MKRPLPRLSLRVGLAILVVAAVASLQLAPVQRALGALAAPPRVADAGAVAAQRVATEHALQRSFARASQQLTDTRVLTLPIPKADADAIQAKALDDLRTIRRSGLAAIAQVIQMPAGEVDAYVRSTDAALEAGNFEQEAGTLLAPDLYTIVSRAGDLSQQVADNATRAMTQAQPTPSPSPTPRR
jgi:hypothetical protein